MKLSKLLIVIVLGLTVGWSSSQEMVAVNEVYVNYLDRGAQTDYFVISNLNGGINVNNAWLGWA